MSESNAAPAPLSPLVSATWVAAHLHADDVVVLDASWHLPTAHRDPEAEFGAAHIPGARRFDLDRASDRRADLPHMLPSPAHFAEFVGALGILPRHRVICYDTSGKNLSAARVWWTFRVFGHGAVAVLDGGFRAWSSATRPVQRGVPPAPHPTDYPVSNVDDHLVRSRAQVEEAVATGRETIVDCRAAPRFRAEVDEPRPGVRRGHVPGARNLPFDDLTDPATGRMYSVSELQRRIEDAGIDVRRPLIAMCGSGTSACVLALAVEVLRDAGVPEVGPPVAIYDGSWAEWGKITAG